MSNNPSSDIHYVCLIIVRDFLRISAVIFSVGTCTTDISLSRTALRTKWWRMSMCFNREWKIEFSERNFAPWLSQNIVPSYRWSNPSSFINLLRKMASFVASDKAIYSASVDDSATVFCFCDFQEIAAPPSLYTYPVYDRRSLGHPAQSSSTYPSMSPIGLR